jgi:hypothetical protein
MSTAPPARTGPKPPVTLISFDIDGTLEFGDPAGPIPLALVRSLIARGHVVVGSASDRTLREQRELWDRHSIEVDFVTLKHHLPAIRDRYACARFVHIGDRPADEDWARRAGFDFWFVHELPPLTLEATILGEDPGGTVSL